MILKHLKKLTDSSDPSKQGNFSYSLLITNNSKKIVIFVALISFFIYAINMDKKPTSTTISVGTNKIYAQIADSENKRSMGLSFTKELGQNAGMLFVFDEIGVKNFWMRDMNFDLDIIWLDENKTVTGFFENVSKDSYNRQYPQYSKIYHSPVDTKYVLEVATGTIENFKIKVGDILQFDY
jgi:uncharacterized membrane protein (UPF0127 family)